MVKKRTIIDYVFDQSISTQLIYNKMVSPIVDDCLIGINGTLLAYGQTASGKTFTMEGSGEGIIYLAVQDLMSKMNVRKKLMDVDRNNKDISNRGFIYRNIQGKDKRLNRRKDNKQIRIL